MNHLDFFGLTEDPFRITPDRNFYFPSQNHTAIREVVRYGLHEGEGFIIVTGEVGTGKTLLLRLMMDELNENFETALILSPHLSRKELLLAILQDIGLDNLDSGKSIDGLLRILNDHLFALSQQGKRLVIVIDEAQNLPDDSLEQLRLLSNFETDTQKLLQIVLFGQPELREKLEKNSLRQLLQRVTIMEELAPLSRRELVQYVGFRFARAGIDDFAMPCSAARQIWRYTHGSPRQLNKLMSRTLLVAYAERQKRFTKKIIREAAASLTTRRREKPALRFLWWTVAAALLFALAWLMVFPSTYSIPALFGLSAGRPVESGASVAPPTRGNTSTEYKTSG